MPLKNCSCPGDACVEDFATSQKTGSRIAQCCKTGESKSVSYHFQRNLSLAFLNFWVPLLIFWSLRLKNDTNNWFSEKEIEKLFRTYAEVKQKWRNIQKQHIIQAIQALFNFNVSLHQYAASIYFFIFVSLQPLFWIKSHFLYNQFNYNCSFNTF